MGIEPIALEGAVVVTTQGGDHRGRGGTDGELAGKRKRGDELAHQPVMHSLWEQDSLEAYTEVLFGCLDSEVEALRRRRVEYHEARRLSDGSDSCWSGADSDSDSEAELEAGTRPPTLEGAVVVAAQGGELVGEDQGALQPGSRAPAVPREKMAREENPL